MQQDGKLHEYQRKKLKQVCEVVCEPLMVIWKEEVIQNKNFN